MGTKQSNHLHKYSRTLCFPRETQLDFGAIKRTRKNPQNLVRIKSFR